MPDSLLLTKNDSTDILLTIPFGATIIVQVDKLFFWRTDYDLIDITQVQLTDMAQLREKIDLLTCKGGNNPFVRGLDFADFVTFVRKKDLSYPQDYYECFVIVVVNSGNIRIFPFDWFNKTGGDYGYVWPAIARLNENRLYGQGMRMADFTVEM